MNQLNLLLFLSFAMLVGSFLSGMIPMAFRLSDSKSRLLALMGSGILVGTALAIIIPEGIESLYGQTQIIPSLPLQELHSNLSHLSIGDIPISNSSLLTQKQTSSTRTCIIGVSLVAGFMLMLLIDQFSIYQGAGGHSNQSGSRISSSHNCRNSSEYSLANQDDEDAMGDIENGDEEEIVYQVNAVDAKPVKDTRVFIKSTGTLNGTGDANVNAGRSSHPLRLSRTKNTKVTPTLGLVIHAAADGIALGAAATTSHREVEMIIFLAIMLHKAPAAFSLVVFLLHRGIKHTTIRKHLLAFSLSAPTAALFTFFGLSQSGKEALRQNNATGIAMLFSAGTFLYVATVHVLPELVHNKLLAPRELIFLVGGAFLPILLAQTV